MGGKRIVKMNDYEWLLKGKIGLGAERCYNSHLQLSLKLNNWLGVFSVFRMGTDII